MEFEVYQPEKLKGKTKVLEYKQAKRSKRKNLEIFSDVPVLRGKRVPFQTWREK